MTTQSFHLADIQCCCDYHANALTGWQFGNSCSSNLLNYPLPDLIIWGKARKLKICTLYTCFSWFLNVQLCDLRIENLEGRVLMSSYLFLSSCGSFSPPPFQVPHPHFIILSCSNNILPLGLISSIRPRPISSSFFLRVASTWEWTIVYME